MPESPDSTDLPAVSDLLTLPIPTNSFERHVTRCHSDNNQEFSKHYMVSYLIITHSTTAYRKKSLTQSTKISLSVLPNENRPFNRFKNITTCEFMISYKLRSHNYKFQMIAIEYLYNLFLSILVVKEDYINASFIDVRVHIILILHLIHINHLGLQYH